MDIPSLQTEVRAWIEQNKLKIRFPMLIKPDLTADICQHPLFSPLLLTEAVLPSSSKRGIMAKANDSTLLNYWSKYIATDAERLLMNYESNDKVAAYNLCIAKYGLVHEHFYNNAGFGKLYENALQLECMVHDTRIQAYTLYLVAKIGDNTYRKELQGFLGKDGNIFKVKSADSKANLKINEFYYRVVSQITNSLQTDTANYFLNKLINSDILLLEFEEYLNMSVFPSSQSNKHIQIESFFELCADKEAKVKLVQEMTGVDIDYIRSVYSLTDCDLKTLYNTATSCGCIVENTSYYELPELQ